MKNAYEPLPDFVDRVMRQVRACEEKSALALFGWLRFLAAGGAVLGMMRAMPVF